MKSINIKDRKDLKPKDAKKSLSPFLLFSPSPPLPITPSPHHPITPLIRSVILRCHFTSSHIPLNWGCVKLEVHMNL